MVSLMINGNIQDSYNTTYKKTFSYFPLYTDNHFSQLLQSRVHFLLPTKFKFEPHVCCK